MKPSLINVPGIQRALKRAARISQRDRGIYEVRIKDIARRFGCSADTIMRIKHSHGMPTFVYRAGQVTRNKVLELGEGRDPYCPCGEAFQYDTDPIIGLMFEFCPKRCSSRVLSIPTRRRRSA
jgi:hypothetical protein